MKYFFYLIFPIFGVISESTKAQGADAVSNSVSTMHQGTHGGNTDYNDWGLLVLIGVIGFTGIISRKKQLERKAD
jgi:hypothetical protein